MKKIGRVSMLLLLLLALTLLGRITGITDAFGVVDLLLSAVFFFAAVHLLTKWAKVKTRSAYLLATVIILLGRWSVVSDLVGLSLEGTTAHALVIKHWRPYAARQQIEAAQQAAVAEATVNSRLGTTKNDGIQTTVLKDDGTNMTLLEAGAEILIRYEETSRVPPEVIARTARQAVTKVGTVTAEGLPTGLWGWVLTSRVDDPGSVPVAGLDGRGRTIPKPTIEEIVYDLEPGEETPPYTTYDHGDETRTVAHDKVDERQYDRCEMGVCRRVDTYMKNGAKNAQEERRQEKKKSRTITLRGGPQGSRVKVTVTTIRNAEG